MHLFYAGCRDWDLIPIRHHLRADLPMHDIYLFTLSSPALARAD